MLDKPGTYWVLAEPVGGRKIQAVGNIVVKPETDGAGRGRSGVSVGHTHAGELDASRS